MTLIDNDEHFFLTVEAQGDRFNVDGYRLLRNTKIQLASGEHLDADAAAATVLAALRQWEARNKRPDGTGNMGP